MVYPDVLLVPMVAFDNKNLDWVMEVDIMIDILSKIENKKIFFNRTSILIFKKLKDYQ